MAKDPAFLFYPNDYIGGTMGMTFEEKGAYMEILMMQFNRGHMTEHMIRQTVGHLWDNLQDKFYKDENDMYFNERLQEEKEKRQKYTASRRNNKSGTNQHTKKPKKQVGHMTEHMENENEDVNINTIKDIINILNSKTGKKFKHSSEKTKAAIIARLNDGFKYEDFEKVIEVKSDEWLNDLKMEKFLRPETLFGTKFEGYLNQIPENKPTSYSSSKMVW